MIEPLHLLLCPLRPSLKPVDQLFPTCGFQSLWGSNIKYPVHEIFTLLCILCIYTLLFLGIKVHILSFSQFLNVHLTYLGMPVHSLLRSSMNWFYCCWHFPYVIVIVLLEFLSPIDHKTYASQSNMIIILLFN